VVTDAGVKSGSVDKGLPRFLDFPQDARINLSESMELFVGKSWPEN
jgi:hypothetical protein